MPQAVVSGTGSYVPPRVVTNDDLAHDYGIEGGSDWVVKRTGIEARRFAAEGVTTSDLAAEASRAALESAGIEAADLDLIVLCTLSPDKAFPGTGVYLQEKLGLPQAGHFPPCIDIRNQCSGFLYGLSVGNAMIRSEAARTVLVVGAEVHSAALDLSTRGRTVASLFGDGAGAVVLTASEERRGILRIDLGADGRFADELSQAVWDMSKRPFIPVDEHGRGIVQPEAMWAQMNGKLVFKHACERMVEALTTTLAAQGLGLDDVDLFCFHQANMRINQLVANHLEIPPDKLVHNIARYGNTTAATIPLLLDEAARSGRLRRGMLVATAAFGSGFTWGAGLVEW